MVSDAYLTDFPVGYFKEARIPDDDDERFVRNRKNSARNFFADQRDFELEAALGSSSQSHYRRSKERGFFSDADLREFRFRQNVRNHCLGLRPQDFGPLSEGTVGAPLSTR